MTDIAIGYNVSPMIDLGSGFVDFEDEPLATLISATGPNDNGPPVETRETLMGFQDMDGNIFAADMTTYEPMGCLENVIPGDACDCDVLAAMSIDICQYIIDNPTSTVGTLDCDGGGIDNATECANGEDPLDPADDCQAAEDAGVDICVYVITNPTSPMALADCDGGGINNLTECLTGEDPFDPSDDCTSAMTADLDICAFVLANPTSPMALADCDGGGINNLTECQTGEDPFDPADDCVSAIAAMVDICAIVLADPTSPLATADCDGGGIDNLTECQSGENPSEPGDDCMTAIEEGIDICAICLLYTSPSPRDATLSRMPSSA